MIDRVRRCRPYQVSISAQLFHLPPDLRLQAIQLVDLKCATQSAWRYHRHRIVWARGNAIAVRTTHRVFKSAGALHASETVPLQIHICCALLQDAQQLVVLGITVRGCEV